mmetsp:Transcript_144129/g.401573  ORF Transcript_144129/g.401573 Transcript_144129/m.401573 type:complete len:357 (-) Transcript_144129:201-1271(-)
MPTPLCPSARSKRTDRQAVSAPAVHTGPEGPGDPVADVLDWLGRYDFRDDHSTSSTNAPADAWEEEAWEEPNVDDLFQEELREREAHWEVTHAQVPRQTVSPVHQPGRLVHPKGPLPAPPVPSAALGCCHNRCYSREGVVSRGGCCVAPGQKRGGRDFFKEEEEEWDQRQRKSGTVGRLVVYHEGESPREDIVLRGGGRYHVVVAGVHEGGKASRVGVRAGDRLVSINGRKDFMGLSADEVRERLTTPSVLVFLGFVGKLQAEVRLTCSDNACGISTRQEVARGSDTAPLQLCEEHIFDVGIASLFLTVNEVDSQNEPSLDDGGVDEASSAALPMFELQRCEAHSLVKRALHRLGD